MTNFNKTLYILCAAGIASCTQMNQKKADDGQRPNSFPTLADAGKAAQSDMLAAIEQKVDLAIDKEALRNAAPAAGIKILSLNPDVLIQADTGMNLYKMATEEGNMLVPYLHNGSVIAVAYLSQQDAQFTITGLGDRVVTEELNTLFLLNPKLQGAISMVRVANLNATFYLIGEANSMQQSNPAASVFSSYKGHNLREPMNEREFLSNLAQDARIFREQYGDSLKKNRLVR
ncbi:MAG: hypothetical protein RL160_1707 [Bacteroidota bacterium]|jgi:hypothetical protein